MDHKLYEEKRKAAEREKLELERKIQLIKEIKELEKTNKDKSNYFNEKLDKTKTPGHGLLTEMSLAELEHELKNIKDQIVKQFELQKQNIQAKHEKQKKLICDVNEQIKKFSNLPKKSQSLSCPVNCNSIPNDIKQLQEKLQQRRTQVQNMMKIELKSITRKHENNNLDMK